MNPDAFAGPVTQAPDPDQPWVENALPSEVRALAARLGATGDTASSRVTFEQTGSMRLRPALRPIRFKARQTMDLRRPAFTWRARMGPLGCVSVTDAYDGATGGLDVRFLGRLRLAHVDGDAVNKGELMRYLAELALAPDAILVNRLLSWRVADPKTLLVSAGRAAALSEVALKLDNEGRITSMSAESRPYADGKVIVDRPWFGSFSDYRRHRGRWLPFAAEVGWVLDGVPAIYWRGQMMDWSIA